MKKVVFHMHSTFSHDGKLKISQLREIGLARGWDFMFLSDHYEDLDKDSYEQIVQQCRENSDDQLQIIPGYEKNWGCDICAFGAYDWDEIDDLTEWVNFQKSNGAFLCLMHPVKYKYQIDQEFLEVVDAIEVWNSKWPYDGSLVPGHGGFKLLNEQRVGLAGQDIHKKTDVTNVVNHVNVDTNKIAAVFQAMREGNFNIGGSIGILNEKKIARYKGLIALYQKLRKGLLFGIYSVWRLRRVVFKR